MSFWWQPDIYLRKLPFLKARGQVIRSVRDFFDGQGFTEVDTPILQVSPGLEVHLHAFKTEFEAPNGEKRDFYLHTSPEFTMKKLLSAGLPKIYQLTHCFRNAEDGRTHSPEFMMLEWYRAAGSYEILMDDCEWLIRGVFEATGKDKACFRGIVCDPFKDFENLTLNQAFDRYADIDLDAAIDDPLAPSADKIKTEASRIGVSTTDFDSFEDVFFKIMLDRIEPKLGRGVPTILCEYPISMAALSRPKPDNPRVAERFELYMSSLELANAFSELTDVATQKKRFANDMDMKEKLYGKRYPIDGDFIAALAIMPESAGIALGIDRLVMLASGARTISDVMFADILR